MFPKFKKYFKTTRFKTTLWYSLIFLLLEIVIGLIIYQYLRQSMYKELDLSLSKQADLIYHFVKESKVNLNNFKPDSLYASPSELIYDLIFEAVVFNPTNTFVQVNYNNKKIFNTANLYDKDIKPIKRKDKETFLYTFSDSSLSENDIRAASLSKDGYEIIVAFPIYVINQTLDSLTNLYIIVAPIFFLLSLAGGSLISFRALSRIDKIIQKTEKITTENLDEVIEGENFDDEYGRLVTTMNKMIRRIKTSIEYMNQFSVSVSHELKTPLTILRGEIELALRSKKTPQEYREILESNYEETLRLINIIERLFYLSKLENSQIRIDKTPTKIKPFLQTIVKSYIKLAEEKNISLILNCENFDDNTVDIDPDLLRQAISNLIDNAIKFSKENSDVNIICKKTAEGKTAISFINYGEEIPQEALPKLFDRFYRAESSRNRNMGGMGLGLSIVKSIVDLHKAEIKVESNSDGKIIFTITI
ncbi:MAG TPA: ATP-binding protein [Ignavibacteriaceae bacterium]|jgi:heavy metal sensor kinase|nr:ATP-binding protein [Ignavibacteriaceae bacterium]